MLFPILFYFTLFNLSYTGDSPSHKTDFYNDPNLQLSPNSFQKQVDSFYEAFDHFDRVYPKDSQLTSIPTTKESTFSILESSQPKTVSNDVKTQRGTSLYRKAGKRLSRAEMNEKTLSELREKDRLNSQMRRNVLKKQKLGEIPMSKSQQENFQKLHQSKKLSSAKYYRKKSVDPKWVQQRKEDKKRRLMEKADK